VKKISRGGFADGIPWKEGKQKHGLNCGKEDTRQNKNGENGDAGKRGGLETASERRKILWKGVSKACWKRGHRNTRKRGGLSGKEKLTRRKINLQGEGRSTSSKNMNGNRNSANGKTFTKSKRKTAKNRNANRHGEGLDKFG